MLVYFHEDIDLEITMLAQIRGIKGLDHGFAPEIEDHVELIRDRRTTTDQTDTLDPGQIADEIDPFAHPGTVDATNLGKIELDLPLQAPGKLTQARIFVDLTLHGDMHEVVPALERPEECCPASRFGSDVIGNVRR